MEKESERETEREGERVGERGREIKRESKREKERETERETEREKEREKERERKRKRKTERERDIYYNLQKRGCPSADNLIFSNTNSFEIFPDPKLISPDYEFKMISSKAVFASKILDQSNI